MKKLKRICMTIIRAIWYGIDSIIRPVAPYPLIAIMNAIELLLSDKKDYKPMELRTRKRSDKNENKKSD